MARLLFGRMEITDFKSIKNLMFEFDRKPGLHFIWGRNKIHPRLESNGCGKTSIFSALCWCLYGRTEEGLRSTDVVPWGGGHPRVKVFIHAHAIERTANPNSLTLDGEETSQDAIERLVGISYEVFCHTILLGQGRPLFFDHTPSAKLKLFEDVLGLERWEERSAKAKAKSEELREELYLLQANENTITNLLQSIDERRKALKVESDQWEAKAREEQSDVAEQIADAKRRLAKIEEKYSKAQLDYDGAETELPSLERAIAELLDYRINAAAEVEHLKAEVERHKKLKSGTCPTCGQKVVRSPDRASPSGALKVAESTLLQTEQDLNQARGNLAIFKNKSRIARATIDNLQPSVTEYKTRINLLSDRRTLIEENANPFRSQLESLRHERTERARGLQEIQKAARMKTRRLNRTEIWVKGFRDIKLHIIEEVLSDLTLTANTMLEQIGLIGWRLEFEGERESKKGTVIRGLNVLIRSPENEGMVRWECWSGGEAQRLRVLGALALAQTLLNRAGIEPSLEILDEPTSHLSPQGVRDMVEVLYERARLLRRVILLADHVVVPSDRFASRVVVERGREGTRITNM